MSRGSCTNPRENFRLRMKEIREMEKLKICVICGRTENQNILTLEDENNGLTERDMELKHCSECGECVCGFCADLQVCH